MTQLFDYRVRVQVKIGSPDAVLLDFIRNERHGAYSHKEMLLWAFRAYWMPFAQQQAGAIKSETQLRQIALRSIYQLEKHIEYIGETFGLEPMEASAKPDRQLWLPLAKHNESSNGAAIAMTPATEPPEQWYQNEHDLFS
jgi:hypothetical protein